MVDERLNELAARGDPRPRDSEGFSSRMYGGEYPVLESKFFDSPGAAPTEATGSVCLVYDDRGI